MTPIDDEAAQILATMIEGLGRGEQRLIDLRRSPLQVRVAVHPEEIAYFRVVAYVRHRLTSTPILTMFLAAGRPPASSKLPVAFYSIAEADGEVSRFPAVAALSQRSSTSLERRRAHVCSTAFKAIDDELGIVGQRRRN